MNNQRVSKKHGKHHIKWQLTIHYTNMVCDSSKHWGSKKKHQVFFSFYSWSLWTCKRTLQREEHNKGWVKRHLPGLPSPKKWQLKLNKLHHIPLWQNVLLFKNIMFIGLKFLRAITESISKCMKTIVLQYWHFLLLTKSL